jgi:hypothetical protein
MEQATERRERSQKNKDQREGKEEESDLSSATKQVLQFPHVIPVITRQIF